MANQDVGDRKDRSGGGDVTKADEVAASVVPQTIWDALGGSGPGRTSEE